MATGLAGLAKPSIRLKTTPVRSDIPEPGVSRMGGAADMPPGQEWPEFRAVPMRFIAQINLDEVPRTPASELLPKTGLLLFFYETKAKAWGLDPNDVGAWRVIYYDGDHDALQRISAPKTRKDSDPPYPACVLTFQSELTWPDSELPEFRSLELADALQIRLSEIEYELHGDRRELKHRMLGYADLIQGDARLQAQLTSHGLYCGDATGYNDPRAAGLKAGAREWELLLQIDSDDNAGMMWGDVGRIYFQIRRSDLVAHDFDHVWFSYQCH